MSNVKGSTSRRKISIENRKAGGKYYHVLQSIGRTGFGAIYIVDLTTQKMEFISEKPLLFSGFQACEVEKMGFKFFRKYTKPEDIEILRAVSGPGLKFYECLPEKEKMYHTITYDFHIKSSDNTEVLINHKITPIETNENGEIVKMVCVASYSLNKNAGNIRMVSTKSDIFWSYNLETRKWIEEKKVILKMREVEIIRFYLQGLTIEEIAGKLCVSPNTIKFHRSKLFDRIGVSNFTEAIAYVVSHHLI